MIWQQLAGSIGGFFALADNHRHRRPLRQPIETIERARRRPALEAPFARTGGRFRAPGQRREFLAAVRQIEAQHIAEKLPGRVVIGPASGRLAAAPMLRRTRRRIAGNRQNRSPRVWRTVRSSSEPRTTQRSSPSACLRPRRSARSTTTWLRVLGPQTRAEKALVPQRPEMANRMRGPHQRDQTPARPQPQPIQGG